MSTEEPRREREGPSRTKIVRDVIVFQGKLVIDGLRDLFLVPISLAAAFIDVLDNSVAPGHHFYRVVRFGRRTERFIDEAVRPALATGAARSGRDAAQVEVCMKPLVGTAADDAVATQRDTVAAVVVGGR